MSVGACNLGRGTARRAAETSKLTDKDGKDKKIKNTQREADSKLNSVSKQISVPVNVAPAQSPTNPPILDKRV